MADEPLVSLEKMWKRLMWQLADTNPKHVKAGKIALRALDHQINRRK